MSLSKPLRVALAWVDLGISHGFVGGQWEVLGTCGRDRKRAVDDSKEHRNTLFSNA